MYRCIPFVVNNTPEKDWLFSILRQTQSIQAQDEWYLEYLPNKTDSDIIILYTIWAKNWHNIVANFYDHWWMHLMRSWWVCFGWLPMCYPLSNPAPPPQCNDHMLPMLWKVDKHSARIHNQSYQNSLCLMSQFHNPYGLIFIYLLGLSVDSLNLFHKIDFLLVWVLLTIPKLLRR